MRRFFFIMALSLLSLETWSQSSSHTHYAIGFKLGSGMQTVTGSALSTIPRLAFCGGLWLQLKLSQRWFMQAELMNCAKGTGLGLHQARYGEYWLNLNYLELPLLFQWHQRKGFVEFGPSAAALINSGEYIKGGALPYAVDKYPLNKRDFSFHFGVGCQLTEKWSVGVRLNHSIVPVRAQLPAANHSLYTRGISIHFLRQIKLMFKSHPSVTTEA